MDIWMVIGMSVMNAAWFIMIDMCLVLLPLEKIVEKDVYGMMDEVDSEGASNTHMN